MVSLKSGFIFVSPELDSTGRAILMITEKFSKTINYENEQCVMWYLIMTTYQNNILAQKMGLVFIIYYVGMTLI